MLLAQGGGDLPFSASILFAMLGVGFVAAALGHLVQSKVMIATGLALIFTAVLVLPLLYR